MLAPERPGIDRKFFSSDLSTISCMPMSWSTSSPIVVSPFWTITTRSFSTSSPFSLVDPFWWCPRRAAAGWSLPPQRNRSPSDTRATIFLRISIVGRPCTRKICARANLDDLVDVVQRNRVDLLEDPHQQARHDRQRQGEADGERGSLAGGGTDVHAAAQVLDPVLDDVHAHAPPRDLGDRLGGAQARMPDERHELAIGQEVGLGCADQPLGDDLAANPLAIDPPAVVADGDDHAVAPMRGLERNRPGAGLAGRFADVGGFQAVIDRVPDHVDERVAQLVDHPLVQLGLLAADLEQDLLARREAEVADDAAEPLEQRADRHHPGVEHALLEAVGDPAQAVDRLGERLELLAALAKAVELVLDLPEVVSQAGGTVPPSGRASSPPSQRRS